MKLVRKGKLCYGCRACELVCTFHHHREFRPGGGAIRVRKDNRTGKISWKMGPACDFCQGKSQPLCVKYCSYSALRVSGEED